MTDTLQKAEWMALWRKRLDDQESRMSSPEAYRDICIAISQDMIDAEVIGHLEKLEMDELANAAYWHAVETLIDCEPAFIQSGFYDVIPRTGGPRIGTLCGHIYYPEDLGGNWAAQVTDHAGTRRLVFRISAEVWAMDGMTLTRPDGCICDLVLTGQRIRGIEYYNIDDPDAYRALTDTAQFALENHDYGTYQRARPLLMAAQFTKCSTCIDHFAKREECQTCLGQGFVRR
jgi:hypothetical protein